MKKRLLVGLSAFCVMASGIVTGFSILQGNILLVTIWGIGMLVWMAVANTMRQIKVQNPQNILSAG